jgi:hypothetical protein
VENPRFSPEKRAAKRPFSFREMSDFKGLAWIFLPTSIAQAEQARFAERSGEKSAPRGRSNFRGQSDMGLELQSNPNTVSRVSLKVNQFFYFSD